MTREALRLNAPLRVPSAIRDGSAIRCPAVLLKANLPVKGWQFSRDALALSAPRWAGLPVWVGSHAQKAEVGRITQSAMLGANLTVELELDDGKVAAAGHQWDALSETSLEAYVEPELIEDEHGAKTVRLSEEGHKFGKVVTPQGVVLLTESPGACSVEQGGGIQLDAEGGTMTATTDTPEAAQTTQSLTSMLKGMKWAGLLALAQEAEIEQPEMPTQEELDALKAKAEAYDSMIAAQKAKAVDGLIRSGIYDEAKKEELLALSSEELGRLSSLARRIPATGTPLTLSSFVVGSDQHNTKPGDARPEGYSSPADVMAAARARHAQLNGRG